MSPVDQSARRMRRRRTPLAKGISLFVYLDVVPTLEETDRQTNSRHTAPYDGNAGFTCGDGVLECCPRGMEGTDSPATLRWLRLYIPTTSR